MNERPITPRKDAFFGFHTDLHAHSKDTVLGADVDEAMVERLIELVKPDYIQHDCKGHYGYTSCPTKIGSASPGIVKDALRIWRDVTKRHGVALCCHYSGVRDMAVLKSHPEWGAINEDGVPNQIDTSTFSSYVDDFMIPQLEEIIANYDLDGVWVDGDCWAAKFDICPSAVEEFKRRTGLSKIPHQKGDPGFREFMDLHREQFRRYLSKYVDALHKFKPAIDIASNWMFSSMMPEPVTVPVDFMSGDYMPQQSLNQARLDARYLASTGMPWDMMAWGFNRGEKQKNWSWKPAIQLQQEASAVLSQGGGWQVVYQGTRSGFIDDWMINILAEVAKFCRERQSLCHKSVSVPQIALLYSTTSLYDASASVSIGPDTKIPIYGPLHALLDLGYSVDVKAEHQLTGHMNEYPMIVIPDWHLLSDEFIAELRDYARQGGNLLLAGPKVASFFTENLGVTFEGDIIDMGEYYADLENKVEDRNLMFLHPWYKEISVEADGMLADCGGLFQKVELTTAEPVSFCYPSKDTRKGQMIASTVNEFDNGMIGGMYASLGTSYNESHAPVLRKAFKKIVQRMFPNPMVELCAPACIDVSIRTKDGKLLINLLNTLNMQTAPDYAIIDYIPPVHNVGLRVRLDAEPESVEWAYGGEITEKHYEDGILYVQLDKLDIHDVLVIVTSNPVAD